MSAVPPRLGKYEITRILGTGAMGVVYEAIDRFIDRRVAIKTIRNADLDEDEAAEQLRRFLIEARAAGKLNHPHIVSLYDHGEEAGITYLVMELVEGRELQRFFDDGVMFEMPEAVRLMGELLDALSFSHRQGVVHRDVKPENIFITDAGSVKLGDFGIARIESSQKTRAGTALGTPTHMAPEQIRGEDADGRSDLYAAGVVLFQLLTGQRPFGGTMLTMALKVLNEPPPLASSLNPRVPPALDAVLNRALHKRAADRFQTAGEFWQALAQAVGLAVPLAHSLPPAAPPRLPTTGGDTGIGQRPRTDAPTGSTLAPTGTRSGAAARVPAPPPPQPAPATRPAATPSPPVSTTTAVARPAAAPPARPQGWQQTSLLPRVIAAAVVLGLLALGGWATGWWRGTPGASSTGASQPAPAAPAPVPEATRPAPAGQAPASAPSPPVQPQPQPQSEPAKPPQAKPTASPAPASPPAAATRPPAVGDPAPPVRPGTGPAPVNRAPAADRRAAAPAAPVAPAVKPPKPERCSDILLKASLEPLTAEESRFLRRECQ